MPEEKIVVEFKKRNDTPGTVRFQEVENEQAPPVVGALYVKKYASLKLGNPEKIRVTIEVVA